MASRKSDDRQRVYIIGNIDAGYIKIGITNHLKRRLANIQTGCPFQVEILAYTFPMDDARPYESMMHDIFSSYNTNGEWFSSVIYDDAVKQIRAINRLIRP